MMNEIRWGIIGCGDVTEVKSGPGFQKAENSKLVAVMRRNAALAEDYARRHRVPQWYSDAQALIDDPDVNAVYIATPPGVHKQYTIAAAKAGKPVYVEKPMGGTHQDCMEMIEACERYGVPLYVAYYRRAQPRFLKVKELLESGAIGEILAVTSTHFKQSEKIEEGELPWRLQPDLSGGGLLYDLASHTLDLLDFLIGPIDKVKGHASNQSKQYEAEDIVSGSYQFASGVHGSGIWCFSAYKNKDVNVIVGTEGEIEFSTFDQMPITLTTSEGSEQWMIEQPQHVQQPMIQLVVDDLLGQKRDVCTGRDGARTNWVMEQLTKLN